MLENDKKVDYSQNDSKLPDSDVHGLKEERNEFPSIDRAVPETPIRTRLRPRQERRDVMVSETTKRNLKRKHSPKRRGRPRKIQQARPPNDQLSVSQRHYPALPTGGIPAARGRMSINTRSQTSSTNSRTPHAKRPEHDISTETMNDPVNGERLRPKHDSYHEGLSESSKDQIPGTGFQQNSGALRLQSSSTKQRTPLPSWRSEFSRKTGYKDAPVYEPSTQSQEAPDREVKVKPKIKLEEPDDY